VSQTYAKITQTMLKLKFKI